jgi:hypothetical protein
MSHHTILSASFCCCSHPLWHPTCIFSAVLTPLTPMFDCSPHVPDPGFYLLAPPSLFIYHINQLSTISINLSTTRRAPIAAVCTHHHPMFVLPLSYYRTGTLFARTLYFYASIVSGGILFYMSAAPDVLAGAVRCTCLGDLSDRGQMHLYNSLYIYLTIFVCIYIYWCGCTWT